MVKIVAFLGLMVLGVVQTYSQDTGSSATEILKKYIQAIGGEEKVLNINSYKTIQESKVNETLWNIEKKVIKHEALLLKSSTEDIAIIDIVRNKVGVNITEDGIFGMSEAQLNRYESAMMIIPEIDYLTADYSLEYLGLSKLDDTTHVYEIKISNSKGFTEVRAYNEKSGLLSIIMSSNKNLKSYSDYKDADGVLFPFTEKIGDRILHTKEIYLNKKIKKSDFEWNTKNDLTLIGEWIAKKNVNKSNQTEFTELKLNENRSGSQGLGVFLESGEKETIDFLTQDIVGWEFSSDTLRIHYYNPSKRELYSADFVVMSKTKTELLGYFSESELDRKPLEGTEELKPEILTFRKTESNE